MFYLLLISISISYALVWADACEIFKFRGNSKYGDIHIREQGPLQNRAGIAGENQYYPVILIRKGRSFCGSAKKLE
jgi:hypothetical protein